jgi:hypothetical protein
MKKPGAMAGLSMLISSQATTRGFGEQTRCMSEMGPLRRFRDVRVTSAIPQSLQ